MKQSQRQTSSHHLDVKKVYEDYVRHMQTEHPEIYAAHREKIDQGLLA